MFGLIFSSLASDLYNLDAAVPDLIRIPINIITIPNPPIHCSILLKNKMDLGKISTFTKKVIPLPVHADMFSKSASTKWISNERAMIEAPINEAHSHAKDDISIPCFSLSLLYFFNFFVKAVPKTNEIKQGIKKALTLMYSP